MSSRLFFFVNPKNRCAYEHISKHYGFPSIVLYRTLSPMSRIEMMKKWLNENIFQGGTVSSERHAAIFLLGQMAYDNTYSTKDIHNSVKTETAKNLMDTLSAFSIEHARSLMAAGSAVDPSCGSEYKIDLTKLSYTERQALINPRDLPEKEIGS